jgi:ketosteroid isomerase-like protein
MSLTTPVLPAVITRLQDAINGHDLDALVECFSEEYVSDTPAHPDRSFVGRDQVAVNWSHLFTGVPDINSRLVRYAVDGATVWAEVEHGGTRRDGTEHEMSGVLIFGISDDRIDSLRFYLEPVQRDGMSPTRAVQVMTSGAVS